MDPARASKAWPALALAPLLLAACAPNARPSLAEGADPASRLRDQEKRQFEGESALEAFQGYRGWHKANPEPLPLSNKMDMLCRNLTPEEMALRRADPHADYPPTDKTFTVFVNDAGWSRMQKGAKGAFPVGTIILKEKHVGKNSQSSEMLTGMVKREKGYNPSVGDWEYFVLSGMAKSIELRGMPKNCVACHATQRDNDYAYADYLPDKKPSGGQ